MTWNHYQQEMMSILKTLVNSTANSMWNGGLMDKTMKCFTSTGQPQPVVLIAWQFLNWMPGSTQLRVDDWGKGDDFQYCVIYSHCTWVWKEISGGELGADRYHVV